MNPDQAAELMRKIQESTEAGYYLLSIELFDLSHWIVFSILGLIYALIWLLLVYDDLEREEGIDRLTWLVVLLSIRLFGPLFYCSHMSQRMDKQPPTDGKPSWARSFR